MPGQKERKFISLAEFKAIDDGPGGFKGYVSKWRDVPDDVGDIILEGAYLDTIPQFRKGGFTADSHDWSFGGGMIGYPVGATEDAIGLLGETRYHSTPDAQQIRTKALERIQAGLDVFLSIGYKPAAPPIIIRRSDYAAEIPKYVRPEVVDAALAKAQEFTQIRVLTKIHLYEWSLVTVPAYEQASVVSAKSADQKQTDVKGMFEEALTERTMNLWTLWDVLCVVLYRLHDMAEVARQNGIAFDIEALLYEALSEFNSRVAAFVFGEGYEAGPGYASANAESVKQKLDTALDYMAHLSGLGTALKGLADRTEARIDMRTKEGRVLSTANWTELVELYERLGKLIEAGKPKPKEDDEDEKGVIAEVIALLRDRHEQQARIRLLQRS